MSYRLKRIYSSDNQELQRLQKDGSVIITPGKDLDGRILTCNPNPFILDISKLTGALIVSNYDFQEEQRLDSGNYFISVFFSFKIQDFIVYNFIMY